MPAGAGESPSRSGKRRPHLKSKTGCAECRQRRVKCDEQRPVCSACARRDSSCVWPNKIDRRDARDLGSRTSGTPSPSSCPPEPLPSFRLPATVSTLPTPINGYSAAVPPPHVGGLQFDLTDLALLYHWSFAASSSICRAKGEDDIWNRVFPEIGFEFSFVARIILGVAALHLAVETRDPGLRLQYINRAISHHNAGLNSFYQAVNTVTPENSEALFVCHGPHALSATDKDQILGTEWIPMMHGIGAVLRPVYTYMANSRLRTFIDLGNWDQLDLDGPDDWDVQMRGLRQTWGDSADGDIYAEALCTLRRCRRFMDQFEHMSDAERQGWGYNQAWSAPFIFVSVAPESFFKLLRQRQPPALVIFAHFGALLYRNRTYWFIGDLGKKIVEVTDDHLGSYWRPYISWPLDFVSTDTVASF